MVVMTEDITDLTLKAPKKSASENVACCIFLQTYIMHIDSVDPDQTAKGAIWSGSTLFATMTFKVTGRRQSTDDNCCDWCFKG